MTGPQTLAPLGRSGIDASRIGMGTWAIGGTEWGGQDRGDAVTAIHTALDQGVTLLDTAPIYGFGFAEEVVGEALQGRRDGVVLASKCGFVWNEPGGDFDFTSDVVGPVHRLLSPASLRRQLEDSLRRLRTDHIDLYLVHRPETATPIPDVMGALGAFVTEGKIGAIGVCNLDPTQMAAYLAAGEIACAQDQYNMLDRQLEADLFPLCVANGVSVMAYSPLAMGLLSGKLGGARTFGAGDMRNTNPRFSAHVVEQVNRFLDTLRPMAARRDVTVSQLVVAWTLAQPGITHVLSGIRTEQQAVENCAAGRVVLTPDDLAVIKSNLAQAAIEAPPVFG